MLQEPSTQEAARLGSPMPLNEMTNSHIIEPLLSTQQPASTPPRTVDVAGISDQ